jgi:hypothetical protein
LDRARLAFVGDANEGLLSRKDRRVALSDEGGSLELSIGTLVFGEVLRRLGADASMSNARMSLVDISCRA